MTPKEKHEALMWVGIVGGVGVLVWVVLPKSQVQTPPTRRGVPVHYTSSHPSMQPNPQQATVDEAFAQARAQAVAMFDQTVLGEQSASDQLQAMNNETQAQKLIAFNTNATQLKEAGIASTTMRDVAGTQASAEENIASQEASAMGQAEHAQQQSSLWGGIMNIFSQFAGFLGFNNPYANPVSYGTGQVYYDQQTGQQINPGNTQPWYPFQIDPFTQTPQDPYSWDAFQIQIPQIQVPQNFAIGG